MQFRWKFPLFGKSLLAGTILAGALTLYGTPQLRAEDCQDRIIHARS